MKKIILISVFLTSTAWLSQASFFPAYLPDLVKDVLSYTNEFRHSKKLASLEDNGDLNRIARKHSQDMAAGRVPFSHDGFDKRMKEARKAIPGLHAFAENVAVGPSSGKDVVDMWKNSSVHRRNMLGNYRYTGIGTAKDRRGRVYYTQVFAN